MRHEHAAPKPGPIRTLAAVAIVLALGFALQWILVTPSPPIGQVQEQIEAARSQPAPLLQPVPLVDPVEVLAWSMARDPFVAPVTAKVPGNRGRDTGSE